MIFNPSCMMYFYDDTWPSQSQLQYFAIYSEQYPTYFTMRVACPGLVALFIRAVNHTQDF